LISVRSSGFFPVMKFRSGKRVNSDSLDFSQPSEKQRSKFRAIREADANTPFHHAQATVRHRCNTIRVVECDRQQFTNHDGKMTALTGFFSTITGQPGDSVWRFDALSLYLYASQPSHALTAPFTEAEVKSALCSMNRCSTSGPDGFGPSFFVATWTTVKHQIYELLPCRRRTVGKN
jgi:hypothetical protein